MDRMTTSIQIPLVQLPVAEEYAEPDPDEVQAESSTGELLLGLSLGVGALTSVHVVWQAALLGLRLLGLLP